MSRLLLQNIHLPGTGPTRILLNAETILDIAPNLTADCPSLDGAGAIALPPLVDGHVHLDKTLLGLPFQSHIPGPSVAERIAIEEDLRRHAGSNVAHTGTALITRALINGTMALRSHADITPVAKHAGLEAELALKQSWRGVMDIQIVAFPQAGIVAAPGVADLLDQALSAGADLIGGLDPAGIDGEITGHLNTIFRLAERHDAGVDIHLHDRGTLGAFELRQIAAHTRRHGRQGRVTVSHAFCLGELSADDFARTAADLASAGISIMTHVPAHVPMPPIDALTAAGVAVFLGSDNIRDAWSPFGTADMLNRAAMLCQRQNWRADADLARAYAFASEAPARALGHRAGPLVPGAAPEILLIHAASIAEAVATQPSSRTLVRGGRVVAANGQLCLPST